MLKAHLGPLLQICKEQNTDCLSSLVRGKDRGVKSKNTSMVLSFNNTTHRRDSRLSGFLICGINLIVF